MTEHDCRALASQLDLYLDRELAAEDEARITQEVARCPDCMARLARLESLRAQLRQAVAAQAVPPGLETRVRAGLRDTPARRSWWWQPVPQMAAALCALAALTAAAWWTILGPDRARIAALLGLGASDHVHCTLERKNPPPGELNRPLPAEHEGLLAAVRDRMPAGFELLESHYCHFHGRRFTHIVFRRDTERVSLIVVPKKDGEDFPRRSLLAAMKVEGISVYEGTAAGMETAGFETRSSLAFVVSQMDKEANLAILARLVPGVRSAIP